MSFCTVFTVRISQRCWCECIFTQIQFQWPLCLYCLFPVCRCGCAVNTTPIHNYIVSMSAMYVIWFISETKIKIKYKRIKKGTPTSQIKNPLKLFKTVKSKPKNHQNEHLWTTVQQRNQKWTKKQNWIHWMCIFVFICCDCIWKKVVWIWKWSE